MRIICPTHEISKDKMIVKACEDNVCILLVLQHCLCHKVLHRFDTRMILVVFVKMPKMDDFKKNRQRLYWETVVGAVIFMHKIMR